MLCLTNISNIYILFRINLLLKQIIIYLFFILSVIKNLEKIINCDLWYYFNIYICKLKVYKIYIKIFNSVQKQYSQNLYNVSYWFILFKTDDIMWQSKKNIKIIEINISYYYERRSIFLGQLFKTIHILQDRTARMYTQRRNKRYLTHLLIIYDNWKWAPFIIMQ